MAIKIDTSTEFGVQVQRRLADERIGWLTTVRPDGMPQPAPVWFHWDGETLLIFTGEARTGGDRPSAERLDAYFKKYAAGMKQLNTTRESLLETYSTAILL